MGCQNAYVETEIRFYSDENKPKIWAITWEKLLYKKYMLLDSFPEHEVVIQLNPFTPKITFIILLTVRLISVMMLIWRIWYWINY